MISYMFQAIRIGYVRKEETSRRGKRKRERERVKRKWKGKVRVVGVIFGRATTSDFAGIPVCSRAPPWMIYTR